MKNMFLFVLLVFLVSPVIAEEETLFNGGDVEYIYRSNKLVHISLYSLIGAGNIGYGDESASNEDNDLDKKDTVFVIEPAVNGTLNVTKWFRISAGISYRKI